MFTQLYLYNYHNKENVQGNFACSEIIVIASATKDKNYLLCLLLK